MMRQCVQITLLSSILVVGVVPVAFAQGRGPDVVATITALPGSNGEIFGAKGLLVQADGAAVVPDVSIPPPR